MARLQKTLFCTYKYAIITSCFLGNSRFRNSSYPISENSTILGCIKDYWDRKCLIAIFYYCFPTIRPHCKPSLLFRIYRKIYLTFSGGQPPQAKSGFCPVLKNVNNFFFYRLPRDLKGSVLRDYWPQFIFRKYRIFKNLQATLCMVGTTQCQIHDIIALEKHNVKYMTL